MKTATSMAQQIYVEGKYADGRVTKIKATADGTCVSITRRQYENAARRLNLIAGDCLRLAPVGDLDPIEVIVLDGERQYAVIS